MLDINYLIAKVPRYLFIILVISITSICILLLILQNLTVYNHINQKYNSDFVLSKDNKDKWNKDNKKYLYLLRDISEYLNGSIIEYNQKQDKIEIIIYSDQFINLDCKLSDIINKNKVTIHKVNDTFQKYCIKN